MRSYKIIVAIVSILISAHTIAQTAAQKLDYLRKNIQIYYVADPNTDNPDFRSIKPATVGAVSNGIIFGETSNNGMNNCALLLLALFSDKFGDYVLQSRVYAHMQIIRKPIVINIINDVNAGIDDKYLSKYNVYVVKSGSRNSVFPAAYSNSRKGGTGVEPGIVFGEFLSSPFLTFKETFAGLVTKIAAGAYGAMIFTSLPDGNNSYHIVSAIGNKFLTVKDANSDAGATLEIRDFAGPSLNIPAAHQVWTFQAFKNRYNFFIKSRQGKVIDLKDGNTANGAIVQMWGMGGYENHRWELIDAGGGYFYIKNWKSGKVLDVSGGVDENGRKVQSYQRNNSASQKWKFVSVLGNDNMALITGEPTYCEKPVSFTSAEIDLNTVSIGYCPQMQDEWESVTTQQLGISAKNRTRHYIGWSAAEKPGLVVGDLAGRNWYPISDFKKVHIGKLCEVGYFDAVGETTTGASWFVDREEKDFNLHVMPSSPYMYQIEKPIIGYDPNMKFGGFLNIDCRDNWVKCGSSLAMEGEITPDDEWHKHPNNPYLGIKNFDGTSAYFLNQNIGMYGPWIVEEVHCNHPEIHPVEMLWSETADPNVKYLIIFQDDSDRFGAHEDYPDYSDIKKAHDQTWGIGFKKELEEARKKVKPWAPSPISAQFYVAFQIDPSTASKTSYVIDVQTSREVVTSASASEIPAAEYKGSTRVIKKGGVELFKVTENQSFENDIGIRFELFKKKNSEIILGYMVISAAVSRDLNGKEGYMVLKLTKQ